LEDLRGKHKAEDAQCAKGKKMQCIQTAVKISLKLNCGGKYKHLVIGSYCP
jgi:hypothetical protein